MDNPADPLKHTFAPSFLAAYRSASTILKLYDEAFKKMGELLARFWPSFAHVLASGIIVGAISAHCSSPLARRAYEELHLAIEVFQAVPQHPASKHGLRILYRLKERGHRMLFEGGNPGLSPPTRPEAPVVVPLDGDLLQYRETQIPRGSPLVLANQHGPDACVPTAGVQRTETVGLGQSSPNLNHDQDSLHAQKGHFTPGSSSSSAASPPDANGSGERYPHQQSAPAGITIHPDVFSWVVGLEPYSDFDQSTWLQTTNEAAASAVVTESDLAASLAMLQSCTGAPHAGAQSARDSQADADANASWLDYDFDMSLFASQSARRYS